MGYYNDRVLTAAESDARVAERFLTVSNLVDPPNHLMRPSVMVRVIAANLRGRRRMRSHASSPDRRQRISPDPHASFEPSQTTANTPISRGVGPR
jgi:hypothetical protein